MGTRFHLLCFLLIGSVGVAGCSGAKSGSAATTSRLQQQQDILDQTRATTFTPLAGLPLSGRATFAGVVTMDANTLMDQDSFGVLDLEIGFAGAGSVDGTIGDFVAADGGPVGGTLTIADGIVDRGADQSVSFAIVADIDGTITPSGGAPITITGFLGGDLWGGDGQFFVGGLTATATDGAASVIQSGTFASVAQ